MHEANSIFLGFNHMTRKFVLARCQNAKTHKGKHKLKKGSGKY